MRECILDYTGEAVVEVRSAGIPGVIELIIHTSETSNQALLDAYALSELRTTIQKTLERTNDK